MPTLSWASSEAELEKLIQIYLKAETDIINEIGRLRSQGLVDYHAVAALERVQAILRKMENDAWEYVPKMIEREFYVNHPEARRFYESVKKHAAGYENALVLTVAEQDVVERLVTALMGEITDAAMTAMATLQDALIGRVEPDIYRRVGLEQVAAQAATGRGVNKAVPAFVEALRREGVTAFVDKAGRRWSLHTYCTMVSRTTRRQAQVLSVLERNPSQDLYKITSHGTTCALCAPYEGRVYSKSGTNPDFPPLADAFGKIDPAGPDNLTNTYLNIHPNCLVPGGFVLAEGVMAHSCRNYRGQVVTLETASGNKITVTPNHPILTSKGFVAAGLLQEGDEIIEATAEYSRLFRQAPNNINIPTRVEEIGHSIIQAGSGTSLRVKGSPVQFHGDGIANSEVDIIFADGFRGNVADALRVEPSSEHAFPTARRRRFSFLASRSTLQIVKSACLAFYRFMRRFGLEVTIERNSVKSKETANISQRATATFGNLGESHALIVQLKKMSELIGSRLDISRRNIKKFLFGRRGDNSIVNHSAMDSGNTYTEMLSNLRLAEPFTAQRLKLFFSNNALVVSKLLHVSTSEYSGKVYNLQTECGFYTYNNIVTHNCLHALTPWTAAGRTDEEIREIKRFSSPKTNPYSRDPRTEKQIEAYRKKEAARAAWLRNYRQWERYRMTLGDKVPKTYQTFERHKRENDDKYQAWRREYREANKEIDGDDA